MPSRENVFDLERLYLLYRNFTGKSDGYFERSPKDMAVRVREHLTDGGKIISSGYGYAMYFVSADAVDVIELVWSQKPVLNELLSMLSAYQKKIIYAVPDYAGRGGAIEEYTMMRVVNAKKLFESILLPGCNFTVSVRDDFCAWNNVRLQVAYPGGSAQVNETAGGAGGAEVNIRDLSRLASGKKTGNKGILSEVFPGQKTCFFNTY